MSYCTTCLSSAQLGHEKTDNMQQLKQTNKYNTTEYLQTGNENKIKDKYAIAKN